MFSSTLLAPFCSFVVCSYLSSTPSFCFVYSSCLSSSPPLPFRSLLVLLLILNCCLVFSSPFFLHLPFLLRLLIFLVLLPVKTSWLLFGPPPTKAVTSWNPCRNSGFGKTQHKSRNAENSPGRAYVKTPLFCNYSKRRCAKKKAKDLKKHCVLTNPKRTISKRNNILDAKKEPKMGQKHLQKNKLQKNPLKPTVNVAQNYLGQHFNSTLASILTSKGLNLDCRLTLQRIYTYIYLSVHPSIHLSQYIYIYSRYLFIHLLYGMVVTSVGGQIWAKNLNISPVLWLKMAMKHPHLEGGRCLVDPCAPSICKWIALPS